MPIPPYMWLKDDGGAHIKGSVDVQDREGSIEIIGLSNGLNLPVDSANGKITGTRQHSSMRIEKEVDSSTPYLYKAASTGQALKSAEIKFYHINDAGQEVCYYTVLMENVKVTGVKEGANKQVISSQADSLIKISRIWADFFPANTSNQPI
ncbi:type VI secretion system tube protein Hcp [Enterobacter cloacae]|uniref:Hcp family type VI secretion system effector n=1 Tax=Enterobacter cloacae TaxID=550 RepID=UPI00325A5A1D